MRIAFFVNAIRDEEPHFTTTALALAALARGHDICYVTPGDFVLRPDDALAVRATVLPPGRYRKPGPFHAALQGGNVAVETLEARDIDVLFLRSDPSLDAGERPWAAQAGVLFGRLAAAQGTIVVNDPDGLSQAQNKLYFQGFPEAVRPVTLISRSIAEIRAFIADQKKGIIIKPLQGSGGRNVFKIETPDDANLNQIFEAVSGEGYLIAQAYLPEARGGDVRFFMMNGRPLRRDGVHAAFRRVPARGEVRSNMHAAGTAETVEVTHEMLQVADMVRPKLMEDGMFLIGLDIVGARILEINVFTPGGLPDIAGMTGIDFCEDIVASLEEKVAIRKAYGLAVGNRSLATL